MTTQSFSYEIEYYTTEGGAAPFREWLQAMRDVTGWAKIRVRLDRARLGNLGIIRTWVRGCTSCGSTTARGIASITPWRETG